MLAPLARAGHHSLAKLGKSLRRRIARSLLGDEHERKAFGVADELLQKLLSAVTRLFGGLSGSREAAVVAVLAAVAAVVGTVVAAVAAASFFASPSIFRASIPSRSFIVAALPRCRRQLPANAQQCLASLRRLRLPLPQHLRHPSQLQSQRVKQKVTRFHLRSLPR